ncbi:MAG: hypothetical protein CL935_02060 [Deltaproteobacteria bacterium]|nr:hypothetical protein [Deltaproteobacteria bacterium]
MFSHKNHLNYKFIGSTRKLIQGCFKTATVFCLILVFFNSLNIVKAHNNQLWKPYFDYYEKGECKKLLQQLTHLSKPEAWANSGLWSRSRIIQSKCHLQNGNYKEALESLRLNKGSIIKDAWLFQKIRVLLHASKQREGLAEIRKLLQHQKKEYYINSLREELKKSFHTDKVTELIYNFLHDTRKNKNWFLKDYKLHSIYIKGADLYGHKVEHEYKVLGWQYPIDEASARLSHKQLKITDLKKMTSKEINNRVHTLKKLGLEQYLMEHLPLLSKEMSRKVTKNLGNSYIKAMFTEKYYSRIIKLYQEGILTKKWLLPKETQLYWTARSYIKRKNIPEGRSLIYKLERLNPNSSHLPILFDTFASRYMLDSDIKKAQFWWNRLLKKFPKHRLAPKSAWRLAWSHKKNNNVKDALLYLKSGLNITIYNSEVQAKMLYWQGKLLRETGQNELADKSFKRLIINKPNTYYGMRFLSENNIPERLLSLVKNRKSKRYIKPEKPISQNTKNLLYRTEFLFDIDESEQAIKELFAGIGNYKDSTKNWHISHLLYRKGEYFSLLRIVANYYLPHLVTHEVGEYPLWELAYPRPYWSRLKSLSKKAGIDPYFALAIMREESHFNPTALSSSKAMGLMQLMPATARHVAKKKKIELKRKEEIYNPELNTLLGTIYLGGLSARFKSELIYTAGSYNAGPHNMIKWIKRWKGKPIDVFVEQIPFNETKNYVKRVYRSYKLYKKIYSS